MDDRTIEVQRALVRAGLPDIADAMTPDDERPAIGDDGEVIRDENGEAITLADHKALTAAPGETRGALAASSPADALDRAGLPAARSAEASAAATETEDGWDVDPPADEHGRPAIDPARDDGQTFP